MYAQDYDENIPLNCSWSICSWGMGNRHGFGCVKAQDLVQPYANNTEIFQCPSAPAGWEDTYDQNSCLVCWKFPKPLAYIVRPTHCFFWGDSNNSRILCCQSYSCWYRFAYANYPEYCAPCNGSDDDARHNGGSNLSHVDGHVKWYATGYLKDGNQVFAKHMAPEYEDY